MVYTSHLVNAGKNSGKNTNNARLPRLFRVNMTCDRRDASRSQTISCGGNIPESETSVERRAAVPHKHILFPYQPYISLCVSFVQSSAGV